MNPYRQGEKAMKKGARGMMKIFSVMILAAAFVTVLPGYAPAECKTYPGGSSTTACWDDAVAADYEIILYSGYGDVVFLNKVRDRYNYQAYEGISTYKGFAMAGMASGGDARVIKVKASAVMPEHVSMTLTCKRWGTDLYILDETVRWLNATTLYGYENWYPNSMSCSIAWYVGKGSF